MTAPESTTPSTPDLDAARLPRLALGVIHTLVLELLLGLANTFWLSVPEEGSGWQDNSPTWLLTVHMLVGLALLVLVVLVALAAWRAGSTTWKRASIGGIVGILLAFAGGIWFMGEVSNDVASFTMAVGWAVALVSYATGLARSARTA